jgi:hypothetical protein
VTGTGAPSVAVVVATLVEAMRGSRGVVPVSTLGRVSETWRVRTHGWDRDRFEGREREFGEMDLYMYVHACEIPGEAESLNSFPALVTIVLSCLQSPQKNKDREVAQTEQHEMIRIIRIS